MTLVEWNEPDSGFRKTLHDNEIYRLTRVQLTESMRISHVVN